MTARLPIQELSNAKAARYAPVLSINQVPCFFPEKGKKGVMSGREVQRVHND